MPPPRPKGWPLLLVGGLIMLGAVLQSAVRDVDGADALEFLLVGSALTVLGVWVGTEVAWLRTAQAWRDREEMRE